MNWIFLNNGNSDHYIELLAKSVGKQSTDYKNFDYNQNNNTLVIRGILKYKLIHRCLKDGRNFYYVDTGYFDNLVKKSSEKRPKLYHRIVPNNIQHSIVQKCPTDRWQQLKIPIAPKKKSGSKILIAAPDQKPCRFYGIDCDRWLEDTIANIKKHSDRPIEIRQRIKDRKQRILNQNLAQDLNNDVHALVTFNSNSATEAVLQGIPIFVTAPVHAAQSVANKNLSSLEDPFYPDRDQIYEWACWLAYCQFHVRELIDGRAIRMLNEFR